MGSTRKKKLRALHTLEHLEPLFKILYASVCKIKSRENYGQRYGKSKASLWRNLTTSTPPKCFSTSFVL